MPVKSYRLRRSVAPTSTALPPTINEQSLTNNGHSTDAVAAREKEKCEKTEEYDHTERRH